MPMRDAAHFDALAKALQKMAHDGWRVVEMTETRPPVPDGVDPIAGVMSKKPGPFVIVHVVAQEPHEGLDHEDAVADRLAVMEAAKLSVVGALGVPKHLLGDPPITRTMMELHEAAVNIAANTRLSAETGLIVTRKELALIRSELGRDTTYLSGVRLCTAVSPPRPKDESGRPKRKGSERCIDCGADPGEACWDDPHQKVRPW